MTYKINCIYIASPLFTPKEREVNEEIDAHLQGEGFPTFLPQRDGFLYVDLVQELQKQGYMGEQAGDMAMNLIFHLDTYKVGVKCNATVINLNGRVPDEGSVVEETMNFMKGYPLVAYCDDLRTLVGGRRNPLVEGLTGFKIVDKIKDIGPEFRRLEKEGFPTYDSVVETAKKLFDGFDPHDLESLVARARKIL
ncbi:MAG: nucleoside 2-deoxyribosyltransferase [archaeon]